MEPLSSLLRNRFALALAGSAALHAAALLAPSPAKPRTPLPPEPLSIRLLPPPAPPPVQQPEPAETPQIPVQAAPTLKPAAPKPSPSLPTQRAEPRRHDKPLPQAATPAVAAASAQAPSSALVQAAAPSETGEAYKPAEPKTIPKAAPSGSGDSKASPLSYYSKGSIPYPPEALRRGQEGTAVLLVEVATDGSVRSAKVSSSSGFSALDQAAVAAVLAWKFNPAKSGGVPVDGHAFVPVVFKAPDY